MIEMKRFSLLCATCVVVLTTFSLSGCGKSEPTVIERTEDYKLTDQESANLAAEEAARKGR